MHEMERSTMVDFNAFVGWRDKLQVLAGKALGMTAFLLSLAFLFSLTLAPSP
jgi:hypothetical protein